MCSHGVVVMSTLTKLIEKRRERREGVTFFSPKNADYTWQHFKLQFFSAALFSISLVSVVITTTPWLHPVVRTTHDNTSNFNFLVLLYSLHMTTLQTVSCNFLVLLYSLTVWWVLSSPECRHHHDTIWHMTTPDWSIIYKFHECCHHDNTMTTLKYIIITNV